MPLKNCSPGLLSNCLAPHPGKCEVLLFNAQFIVPFPAIYIGGNSIIEYKATSRLLGVTLDQNLGWIPHLKEVTKNIGNKLVSVGNPGFYPDMCASLFT